MMGHKAVSMKPKNEKIIELRSFFSNSLLFSKRWIKNIILFTFTSVFNHFHLNNSIYFFDFEVPFFSCRDTVCDLGFASELANYGEYSGDPNETQTFEYAKTILTIMTEGEPHPKGKVLIIGGSIANFTNVSATFKVIFRAKKFYENFEIFRESSAQWKCLRKNCASTR